MLPNALPNAFPDLIPNASEPHSERFPDPPLYYIYRARLSEPPRPNWISGRAVLRLPELPTNVALPRTRARRAIPPHSYRARPDRLLGDGMRKRPGLLEKVRRYGVDHWIASFGPQSEAEFDRSFEDAANPGRRVIKQMTDEDLAELIADRPGSKLAKLAESELRVREAWRGPARWSLIVAAIALIVSIAAFMRTLPV